MKTNAYSSLAAAVKAAGSSRADPLESMIEERQRQRLRLTPRELEVLCLLCEGLPNKLIERRLKIGAGTVKCHVASILSKLGVSSRLQAVVAAHRFGLLELAASAEPTAGRANGDGYEVSPEATSFDRDPRLGMMA